MAGHLLLGEEILPCVVAHPQPTCVAPKKTSSKVLKFVSLVQIPPDLLAPWHFKLMQFLLFIFRDACQMWASKFGGIFSSHGRCWLYRCWTFLYLDDPEIFASIFISSHLFSDKMDFSISVVTSLLSQIAFKLVPSLVKLFHNLVCYLIYWT